MELEHLFSPGKIGNVQIKNKIIRSATWVARATEDGYITDDFIEYYSKLAKGGVGLIISGYIAVDLEGAATPRMARLYNDSYIPGQKTFVKSIHEYSDVKIAAQIAHTGSNIYNKDFEPVGPSPIWNNIRKKLCRELTTEEVRNVIKRFVETGCRAYEIGYDMVQIHGAHGYLLSDFVSPVYNKRTDEFGGDYQKRAKILVDIFNQLRDELGKNYPIFIKLNTRDYMEGGLELDEAKKIAKILIDTGYEAIEPSCGRFKVRFSRRKTYPAVMLKSAEDENYFLPNVKTLKPVMKNRPIILMGGVRNPLAAEKILKEKTADFIAMCRPLIYEPDLPNRWKSGDTSPALCISCNACLGVTRASNTYCVTKKKLEEKK